MFGKRPQHKGEIRIPPIAEKDSSGVEILRAWVADGGFHVSLKPEVWNDAGAWGIALADIVRHLSDAYHGRQGSDKKETTEHILALLHAELDSPTDEPTGCFVD